MTLDGLVKRALSQPDELSGKGGCSGASDHIPPSAAGGVHPSPRSTAAERQPAGDELEGESWEWL